MNDYDILIFIAGFVVIALASNQFGHFFVKTKLPLISGFLLAGIIAGPYVLGMIKKDALENLRFVDQTSLALIAFAAGSELYLRELTSRMKSIAWVTVGLVLSTLTCGSLAIFFLADYIPFMQDMPVAHRIGVAALGGAILVARSPASAIAVMRELRAKGPFTQTALGVTVIMDGVVIILFAVNSSIADALLTDLGFDASFVMLLLLELFLSFAIAYPLAKLLQFVLWVRTNRIAKTVVILAIGYGVFALDAAISTFTHHRFHIEISVEPLLICMVASFLITNYSKYRTEFLKILHNVGPPVYVAFFTLTGASLALDVLAKTWGIALAIFAVRLTSIFFGSFSGGMIAKDPIKSTRVSWMCYVTQAGVALGLATEAAGEFTWGTEFATIIIAVVVLNQIVGPPLFKLAITMVGEAHVRESKPTFEGVRNAIIFGSKDQSMALARQLRLHDWHVQMASTEPLVDGKSPPTDLDIKFMDRVTLETLQQVGADHANTIVAMLSDEENYQICELAYENFGTDNMVVRLNDRANFDRFSQMNVLVVDSTSAMINILDHSVRSPTAASLLLGMEDNQDIVDLEVRNPDLRGIPLRDLRLPLDTLVLSVHRAGKMLISHGDTQLKIGDRMTVVGSEESLEEVMVRFSDPFSPGGHQPRKREPSPSGLRVDHVMRHEVKAIQEDANFDKVVDFVTHSKEVHFPIVDRDGMLKGLISFEEIRSVLFDEKLNNLVIASDLASEEVPQLSPTDSLEHAISQFEKCGLSCLPVISPNEPRILIGLLDQRAVLHVYHHNARTDDGKES